MNGAAVVVQHALFGVKATHSLFGKRYGALSGRNVISTRVKYNEGHQDADLRLVECQQFGQPSGLEKRHVVVDLEEGLKPAAVGHNGLHDADAREDNSHVACRVVTRVPVNIHLQSAPILAPFPLLTLKEPIWIQLDIFNMAQVKNKFVILYYIGCLI
jgi:hypothetical protein